MKVGDTEYVVDYEFFTRANGERTYSKMQMGFKTEAEAQEWANANTSDGKVSSWTRIW